MIASFINCPFISIKDLQSLVESNGSNIPCSFDSEHIAFGGVEHHGVVAGNVIVTVLAAVVVNLEGGHSFRDVDRLRMEG